MVADVSTVVIRDERPDDADAIGRLHEAAFGGAIEAAIVALLRRRQQLVISRVADLDGRVVGHVALSPVSLAPPPATPWRALGLGPLAVTPSLQRLGLGTRLMKDVLDRGRGDAWEAVVVLGDPAYYGRFGFTRASDAGLGNTYGVDDPFMVLRWTGSLPRGVVHYDDAFALECGEGS